MAWLPHYPRPLPDEPFRSADLARVALLRLFCERLLVDTFGRDEDWLFTVVLRLGRPAPCVDALVLVLRAGVARCVRVDVRLLWLTVGLLVRCTLDVDRLWCSGTAARVVVSRDVLVLLRTEFVSGEVARVRAGGAADSRVRLLLLVRTVSPLLPARVDAEVRLLAGRVAVPRAAVVLRLFPADTVAVRLPVALLVVRTADASATLAGRADERLLRSTSGR